MSENERALERLSFPIQYLEIGESLLRARGVGVDMLYRLCGIPNVQAILPGQTINGKQMRVALEMFLDSLRPEPAPLVQLMAHFPLTIHGPLGVLALTSATLGEALEGALKYAPLVMPAFSIRQEVHGQFVHIIFERLYDFGRVNDIFTESVVATFLKIKPFLAQEAPSLQVHYSHAPLGDVSDYERHLGAKFFFHSGLNQIILHARDLNIPLLAPSRSSRLLMQTTLEQQRLQQADARPCCQQVRRLLQQSLQEGKVMDAGELAARLNISSRTLSRRLQAEGATLPQLQAEVGLEFAEVLLLEGNKSIADIARSAGFRDATSFSRAFRRVMGRSPSQFRGKDS